jgi:hypothetical protein
MGDEFLRDASAEPQLGTVMHALTGITLRGWDRTRWWGCYDPRARVG